MKKIWKIGSIALICGILSIPQMDAGESNRREQRSMNNNLSRMNRNGENKNLQSGKPGNVRPGNNRNDRPSGNINNGANNYRVGGNHNNGEHRKPSPGIVHNNRLPRPNKGHVTRPHCPPARPYHRPTPPPSFRPYKGCPVLHSILGITFGTAINLSLEYLNNKGYSVDSYGNDVVYLSNVNELNYLWHDATLYYDSNGLTGSQFIFSTNYNNKNRYNMVYDTLVGMYGNPVRLHYLNNGVVATWWGADNQYVSLEYRPNYSNNGQLRYVTTLSYGV